MSRSALWRQEINVKERTRVANETFQIAVEEGRVRAEIMCFLKFCESNQIWLVLHLRFVDLGLIR